jgi:signal transduction histidine kinase
MPLSKPTRATGLVGLIVVLLAALTALQYGWIGELSEFQRQQMERNLRASTDRFVGDLDGEFERLFYAFRVRRNRSAGGEIAEDHAEWAESFDLPELIAEAFWVKQESGSTGRDGAPERLSIERISLENGQFDPAEWPPWLTDIQGPLIESANSHRGRDFHADDSFTFMLGDRGMAFVVAQTQLNSKSWAVVVLRHDVMVEQFLPALVRDHFGADDERDYEIRLFDEADDDGVIFASASDGSAADTAPPDLIRHLRDFGGFVVDRDDGGDRTLAVAVTHRAGSVDAAVAQLRRNNLGFSFGVVLVLAASVGVLVVAAQRARRLAARQMEFVAGVSHELRTPIAGISSLSQNLADGVVQDLEQAAHYGATIHQESHRLANMVEGVLHFSAIRSGRYRYEMRDVDVRSLVDAALKALKPAAVERCDLTVSVEDGLPPLLGDERALQSVVRNLVSNAMKFSEERGEIRLSARVVGGGREREIELSVEDAGPGIDAAELSQVFEPFFRGRAARTAQAEGSGLGLSLVKEIIDAHGGRVEVSANPGDGSTFRVFLPTAGAAEVRESSGRLAGPDQLQTAGDGGGAT